MRGWVARRELHSFFQRCFRLRHPAKAEMQFRHARPGKAKFRIDLGRVLCRFERARKIGLRLQVIRFRDPIARGLRRIGIGPRFQRDGRDQRQQSLPSRGSAAGGIEQSVRLVHLTDGQQQTRVINFVGIRTGPSPMSVGRQRRQQIALVVSRDRCVRMAGITQFLQIKHARIIETPLDGIDRLEHRRLPRPAAHIHFCLLAAGDHERALRVG